MLELVNLTIYKKKDDRPLIKNLNFILQNDDKIAVIGEEGNGKSTLLKAIVNPSVVNEYCTIEGTIKTEGKIGYLEQILDARWNDFVVADYLLKNDPSDELNYEKYNELSTIAGIISKVKLDPKLIESNQLIGTLSGGEKVKLQLAKILCQMPDILLLDEPTNDLDLETLNWLENFINNLNVPIIFISHDETLLERTANGIIHLEQIKRKTDARYTIERISYQEYVEKRLGLLQKQEQVARKQQANYQKKMEQFRQVFQKVEYQQETITRADPHGARLLKKKIKSLKSQEKRYEKEKEDFESIPDVEESINFMFSSNVSLSNSKHILDLNLPQLTIDNKVLSSNIKLNVVGPTHIVIVGQNGVGKTTLFKQIYLTIKDRKDIKVGYMPQNYDSLLPLHTKAIDFLASSSAKEDITKARTLMGSMKFTNEEATGPISELSGGQKAKLLLLKLILDECNVLMLDEPTRNLSPLSNPVIRSVLANYKGAIISISHDRKYINEVCNCTYELTKDGLKAKKLDL